MRTSKIIELIKNKSGLMFALLFMLLIGAGAVMAKTATDNKKKKNGTTKKDKLIPTYTFFYNGPNFSVGEVTKESNWVYDSSNNTCSGDDDQACTIKVNAAYVDNPTTAPTLRASTNLSATLNSIYNTAYVTGSSDVGMLISNAEHP